MDKDEVRTDAEIQDVRWQNRRKMAWKSFKMASWLSVLVIIGIFVLIFFGEPSRISAASSIWAVLGVIFGGLWGVVMAYIGTSAYSEVRNKVSPKPKPLDKEF